uniref:Uncharacterized protein n=1 Tax=Arundo donax TaxID=35708 RepID=A0A0A9FEV1_ARUDO
MNLAYFPFLKIGHKFWNSERPLRKSIMYMVQLMRNKASSDD